MTDILALRRLYKNSVELNRQRSEVFKMAFQESPDSAVWGMLSYTFDEWFAMCDPSWQAFTAFSSEISNEGFNFRIGSSFKQLLYPPAEVSPYLEYKVLYSAVPRITPTCDWSEVGEWKKKILMQTAHLINPAGVFLYAAIKYAHDMGWKPVHLIADPQENKYAIRFGHPDREQFIEIHVDYTGTLADYDIQMQHMAANKE